MQISLKAKTEQELSSLPTRIMVVGYKYKVDFGQAVLPRVHLVDKQRRCSCELGADCPAIEAVVEYLRIGGQRAPDPLPPCPICGEEIVRDRKWNGKYTKELGWRCTAGGLSHFLQAKALRIREALRRKQAACLAHHRQAASEHESEAGR